MPQQFLNKKTLVIGLFFLAALVGIPVAVIQLQQQQELRQRAEEIEVTWETNQSASTSCPTSGGGAVINVTFSNTEPNRASLSMDVVVTDQQSGKSTNLGSVAGGQTKTGQIQTGRTTLNAGSVRFNLTWTDGRSGVDSRTASYKAVSNCQPPTPSPTPSKTPTPSPTGVTPTVTLTPTTTPTKTPTPTPTICPTLGPVQNVRIECPNCP